MILVLLIAIPLLGGILSWVFGRKVPERARWISFFALLIELGISLALWLSSAWRLEVNMNWIPEWGVHFHLGLDGLSLLFVILSAFLGVLSVLASWQSIRERVGLFHLNLLWVIAGVIGVFLSFDLFLFYFFWELMLVPMYFLIALWGHENRSYAAIKFFLFTQASGLLMLISILGLYFIHGQATGSYTFDYEALIGTPMSSSTALWLTLGFFVAFAVKLPVVPFHTWLPDAHTEAPTAGSVVLAGLLLKTGGYGLIRFVLPLFPEASTRLAPVASGLAVAGILYGSVLAFAQRDLKRLVAYTSVSHLGFVLLGIFAGTELALKGAIVQMLCHGLSTGALFIVVGAIQDRVHTRDLRQLGGIWSIAPRMGSAGLFFALASLGLPGMGNFIGEFLTLLGTFQANPLFGILGSLGFIVSTIYSLWLVQAVFHGPKPATLAPIDFPDFSFRETLIMGALMVGLLWMGVYPQPILKAMRSLHAEVPFAQS